VGNALSTPVARWLGERLQTDDSWEPAGPLRTGTGAWAPAGWGEDDRAHGVDVSAWPVRSSYEPLADFLRHELRPLSSRATAGFLSRTERASLRFLPEFIEAIERHVERMSDFAVA